MKRVTIILIAIFFLTNLISQAQDKKYLLFPQFGNTSTYEFTESKYLVTKDGEKVNEFIRTKLLEVNFSNVKPENKELLRVRVIKNTAEKPQKSPYQFRDYEYPEFKDGFYSDRYNNFYKNLIGRITFKYEFNPETSEVKLNNREEILLDVRKILEEKGFNKKGIDRNTDDFNTKAIPQITNYLRSLYQVSSEILDPAEFEQKIVVKDSISKVTAKGWDKKPGLYSQDYSINMADRFLKEYNEVELDTLKRRKFAQGEYHNYIYEEKNISLKEINKRSGTRLTISGKVKNQRNKKVTLVVLRNTFDTEMYQETTFLDENNTFYFETDFKHAGLVFLIFGQTTSTYPNPIITLYAEPGSQIQINTTGESFPWNVDFSGDFNQASKMVYEFNKEYNLLNQYLNFNTLNWRVYKIECTNFINALANLDSFSEKYKNTMEESVFNYVTNELKANLLSGVVYYLHTSEMARNNTFYRMSFPEQDKIDEQELKEILNSSQIHKIYNPYGIYSRQFASDYLEYHFQLIRKIGDLIFPDFTNITVLSDFRFYQDLPQKIEVAKTLLTGHALYGQIANMLVREKMSAVNQISQDEEYMQNEVENYLDLIIRVCNNKEFTDAIKLVLDNHSKWEKKDYAPETKFFNEKGEPKYFKDFFGKKPTVFKITQDWSPGRYHWDDLAIENPEINFVLVMEGSNFTEWKDYTTLAEPVAHQLFLINTEQQLRDIFKKNSGHFIAYDKDGVRIGYEGNATSAMNLCKQSLMTPKKKQLDKSQLQIIVIVLVAILTTLIIGLIVWKWRVRQRFRKEAQFRRLRELELTAIRSQMNPHFLFNSLNSVQNLVQQNKGREAHLYLADFAGLIRKVLRNSEKEEVSLAEELEMTEQYLNLEKLRFDFEFSVSVEENIDANNTMVPSMLLQPFAENAVIHGLQSKPENRQLKIEVLKENTGIKISIEDNGIGREAAKEIAKTKNGKGSKLIKERLEILQEKQGEKYRLETIDLTGEQTGTRIEIFIPEEK